MTSQPLRCIGSYSSTCCVCQVYCCCNRGSFRAIISFMGPNKRWNARLSSLATFRFERARTVAARGASFSSASSTVNQSRRTTQINKAGTRKLEEKNKRETASKTTRQESIAFYNCGPQTPSSPNKFQTKQRDGQGTSKIIPPGILLHNPPPLNNNLRLSRLDQVKVFTYVALMDHDFAAVKNFCFEGVGDFGFFPGVETGEERDCA